MDTDIDRWQRLARAVRTRRKDLGLTKAQVSERGGPSIAGQTRIESVSHTGLKGITLRRLDKGLDWPPGYAKAIVDGLEDFDDETERRIYAVLVHAFDDAYARAQVEAYRQRLRERDRQQDDPGNPREAA